MMTFLQHKADPNALDESGQTPFHYVCMDYRHISVDVIDAMLHYNADLNMLDDRGFSPLHYLLVHIYDENCIVPFMCPLQCVLLKIELSWQSSDIDNIREVACEGAFVCHRRNFCPPSRYAMDLNSIGQCQSIRNDMLKTLKKYNVDIDGR